MLGLPDEVTACLFDLDGVLTPTAEVHAKAWKETFDAFLAHRAEQTGDVVCNPSTPIADYDEYVDGKPRYEGVQSFLESRGIELPRGDPDDAPGEDTDRRDRQPQRTSACSSSSASRASSPIRAR